MDTVFIQDSRMLWNATQRKEAEIERRHGIGTNTQPLEKTLQAHEKKTEWNEPKTETFRICPVCGTTFKAHGKRIYCSNQCNDIIKHRRYYKRQRIKDAVISKFKPHIGKTGEVYFLNGKRTISFIPAIHCINLEMAKDWLSKSYQSNEIESILKQVKGFFSKEL
ncbi:unnamed protein product [marine sediment metagenome]|uniref:Uncharacterized protein n=1 Tax=marine sediment metagenome TaxID=412755 RepID=X1ESL6_9ZZZZ